MRIGILGSGLMGGTLGMLFGRAGHEVVFSYAHSRDKLKRLARDAKGKARSGTPREAAQEADAALLAVRWSRMDDVLNQAGDLSGKVIVSCSLPMNDDSTALVLAHTSWARRRLQRGFQRLASSPLSTLCRANCFLASSSPSAKPLDPASCTAGTIRAAKGLPLS